MRQQIEPVEMDGTARITILVEDTAGERSTLGEHGLAVWVEIGGRRALFDTGQGMALLNNARELGVRLEETDRIVLSHGHYDHTGGIRKVLCVAQRSTIYVHPAAFRPKFVRRDDGACRHIGMSVTDRMIQEQAHELVLTNKPTEICDGLFVTGEIPRVTEFEDTGGPFFSDEQCQRPDLLMDDQALFFECRYGIVVILGCAHAGVINTLRYVRRLTDGKHIHAVVGGMHLVGASRERMARTVAELCEFDVDHFFPGHCTGLDAVEKLRAAFPGKCCQCIVGTSMKFEI